MGGGDCEEDNVDALELGGGGKGGIFINIHFETQISFLLRELLFLEEYE